MMIESVQERTYQNLREALHRGDFQPGEKLKIRQLAARWGVSAMPIRAALQRLVAEGVLDAEHQRSVRVPLMSASRYRHLLDVRLLLEGYAAEKGATRLDDEQKQQMRELLTQMREAIIKHDAPKYLDANSQFHLTLYRASGNPLLNRMIDSLWLQTGPLFHYLFDSDELKMPFNEFHVDVMQAIDQGDGFKARAAIEADLRYFGKYLTANMDRLSANA